MNKQKLVLYISLSCPYCQKIAHYLKENDIKIDIEDVSSEKNRQHLLDNGGKTQVPCLFIDGRSLYESNDIIEWFESNK